MKNSVHADNIPYEQIRNSIELGIFENLHIAVALVSEKMEIVYCNAAFVNMYGLPEKVTGRKISDCIPMDRRGFAESLKRHKVSICLKQSQDSEYVISMSYPVFDDARAYRGVFLETVPMTSDREALRGLIDSMRTVEIHPCAPEEKERKREKGKQLHRFEDIIGQCRPIRNLRVMGAKVARSDEPILILGESGTGKELVAQAIHTASPRSAGPFVCVNCAALPSELMESELFGYEAGAFTGARASGMKGKFEEADKGTIFLDEIGEMPLGVQAKLLRVLESGEIQKIGHKGSLRSDFRLVTATNKNLLDMVRLGLFREDLYHRLNVFELNIPPLRDRGDDLFILVRHFMQLSLGLERSRRITLSNGLVETFRLYSWPGNVRELRNIMTHALFLMGDEELELGMDHLPLRFQSLAPQIQPEPAPVSRPEPDGRVEDGTAYVTFHSSEGERKMLQDALIRCHYNKVRVSRELGISRSKLYRDIRKYGLLGDTH